MKILSLRLPGILLQPNEFGALFENLKIMFLLRINSQAS
jgi:hypothetical protein